MGYESVCDKCDFHKSCNTNKVETKIKLKQSDILIVLDAPDRDDDFGGTILSKDAGRKMLYLLERAGIPKDRVSYTYAVRCKPSALSKIKKKHMDACRPYLMEEITKLKPKIVVLMGRYAHETFTGETSIGPYRGHFSSFDIEYPSPVSGKMQQFKVNYIPSFSPYGSMAKWEWHDYMIHDLKKAADFADTGEIPMTPVPKHKTILSLEDLYAWRDHMLSGKVKWCVNDFETTGVSFAKHKIFNAGYCDNLNNVFIVYHEPYTNEHAKKWDTPNKMHAKRINDFVKKHKKEITSVTKEVHAAKIAWVFHNGKFDCNFARKAGFPHKFFWWDTLISDSIIDENKFHSLNIAMEYRGINFGAYDTKLYEYVGKKAGKTYQFIPPLMIEDYLCRDVYGDALLLKHHKIEIEQEGMYDYFMNQRMPALRMMTEVEYHGVKADRAKIIEVDKMLFEKIKEIEAKAKEITGNPEFNIGSAKQLSAYMVEAGYPFAKLKIKENTTGYSTDKASLLKFAPYKKWGAFPKMVLEYKALAKIAGTYVAGKIGRKADETGGLLQYLDEVDRIHANYNLWTPRTSRYSCNKPSLQVWPRPLKGMPNIRNFIIPREGWTLFEADYSQLEQCVVAALSEDLVLINKIMSGTDLHCFNAVELGRKLKTIDANITYEYMMVAVGKKEDVKTDIKEEDIPDDIKALLKILRTQAKNIGFGLNYGKSAVTFATDFGIELDEAEEMVEAYFSLYKKMKAWRDRQVEMAMDEGYVTLLSGRKRRFHQATDWLNSKHSEGLWGSRKLSEEIARQAMNAPVQGGAHDIFEPACIRLVSRFKREKMKARLLLSIHDGIVGECPPEERERVEQMMKEELTYVLNKGKKTEIKFKVDTDFYKYEWYGEKLK